MPNLSDFMKSSSREVDVIKNEIAIFKNLIKERKGRLDLVRELVSNAGAREVGATRIEISYTRDRDGHIFEVTDNGCGMDFTGSPEFPGRLDRFLGLGLSAIAGQNADEFSWKGLGSKLSYQSRRVEIETKQAGRPQYHVTVNEPWSSLERNLIPKPRVSEYTGSDDPPGTRIRVIGHPPHSADEPFRFEDLKTYLQHRTFAGFTKCRDNPPEIVLSVLGETRTLEFGFPEFRGITWPDKLFLDTDKKQLLINLVTTAPGIGLVALKGFLVWDAGPWALSRSRLNTGLVLSSRGIPYFELPMDDYGSRSIIHANPGIEKTCLVVECDGIHSEMNISRSDLVDSAQTDEFKRTVRKLFDKLEGSPEYREFRQIPSGVKRVSSADQLAREKQAIEAEDQTWVVYDTGVNSPLVLMREPKNEVEVNALIWKLEALGALPFERFQTLAYVGALKGPDMLVNFQEEKGSEPLRSAVVEVENNFYNYTSHGHYPGQYPKVICWDIPTSGRKVRLEPTSKKWRFRINLEEYQVHVYVLKLMDGVKVLSRRELKQRGVSI